MKWSPSFLLVLASVRVSPLLIWVLGSAVIFVLAGHIGHSRWGRAWRHTTYGSLLVEIGRFALYIGVPYLALGGWPRRPYDGLLSLYDLGLVGWDVRWPATRWIEAAGTSLGLGLAACVVMAWAWRRSEADLFVPRQAWWFSLIQVIYVQVHWAFYRASLVIVADSVYIGVFTGLGLALLEWVLNPAWRGGWRVPSRTGRQWIDLGAALVTALVYLYTRNTWGCLVVHLGLRGALGLLAGEPGSANHEPLSLDGVPEGQMTS